MKKVFVFIIVMLFLISLTSFVVAQGNNNLVVGGQCSYDTHSGTCKIISIEKTDASKEQINSASYEGFEIKFKFTPTEDSANISEEILNEEYLLQLINSWYPGPAYLEKYNIEEDGLLECNLSIKSSGTCSPIGFEFQDINRADYFESETIQTPRCPAISIPAPGWCADGKIVKARDENNCQLPPRCLTQEQVRNIVRERNRLRINQTETPENCVRSGSTLKCDVESGRVMTVSAGRSGNIIVQVKGVNMSTKVELYKSNDTFYGKFDENVTKPINYLPDHVRDMIKEKIHGHLEDEEIELDEEGIYKVQFRKRAKLFGLFRVRERVRVQMDPETGNITRMRTSWWGFLAKDDILFGSTCGTVSPTGRNECCINKGFDEWNEENSECM